MVKYISRLLAESGVKTFFFFFWEKLLLPAGMPMVTLFLGWASGVGLFYIWLGFLASLAFVFLWLNQINEWLYKRSVENKVSLSGVEVFRDQEDCYGVQLQFASIAEYPIDIRAKITKFQLKDKVPPKEDRAALMTIPAYGKCWRNTNTIGVDNQASQIVEGCIEYDIEYGRHKNLNHVLDGAIKIALLFDELGELKNWEWQNAEEE